MKKLIVFFLLLAACNLSAQKVFIKIPVTVANQPGTPMRVQLVKPLQLNKIYYLQNQKTHKNIPVQLLDSSTLVFMTEEKMAVGDHMYSIITQKNLKSEQSVTVEKVNNGLLVKVKGKPVFLYHTKDALPPADSPAYYKRSGFIHPLYSPSGKIVTDDFPLGHAHQHAIFTAWANTTFKKASVDFWNQQSKKGTVEHIEVLDIIQGPVVAQIRIALRHKSHEFGEVLREVWKLTIYPTRDYFLFDLESEQKNTSKDTLFLKMYHYGGLAFRGSRQWNIDDHINYKSPWNVLTSEGMKDSSANATRARWVDASGRIDDAIAGTAVFNHPSNFRYPQSLRVHPTMPYWAFSPVVDGPFYIAPGAFYRSRFRYYVHDGRAEPEFIEKLYSNWTDSTSAKVTYGK